MPPSPEFNSPSQPPRPSPSRHRSFPWLRLGLFLGATVSVVGLVLAAWAWIFINEELSPVISQTLTEFLERPVDLGDVEKVTLSSVQVGPSKIDASASDTTTVSVDSVLVRFNLIKTLLTSELGLDLTLVGAEGYLKQDVEKGWLNFAVPEQEEQERRFKVRLDDVRVRNSRLTLVPLPAEDAEAVSITIDQLQGNVAIDQVSIAGEEAIRTRFEASGAPVAGGELTIKGELQPIEVPAEVSTQTGEASDDPNIQLATNLSIQADQAPLADVLYFTLSTIELPNDQVSITSGEISGTTEIDLRPNDQVDYSGVLSVENAEIATELLPLAIENAEGQGHFQGNQWTVDRLSGRYGEIDAVAQGHIDFDSGYALDATAKNVSVEDFTNTIDLELPVPTEGSFNVIAQMKGPIDQPEFSGTATAITPLTVDKITFTSAATDFLLQGQQLYLNSIAATPSLGGSVRGSGRVNLTEGSPFTFEITGRDLPAGDIAQLYDINPNVKMGLVSADATVVGNASNISTTVDWDAPTAEYPGSGTVDINGTDLAFRDTVFQIGGGTASGSGTLVDGLWDSDVTLANINLNDFSEDLIGDVSGQFRFSGSTADTSIGTILGSGDVAFSNGLATFNREFDALNQPLTAQVAWNGEKIAILRSNSENLSATGTITPVFDRGFEGLERFDLNVTAQDYDINEIPFIEIPEFFTLAGRTNFTGTLAGNPEAPSINGTVQATNVIVNRLPFNPLLTGTVSYTPTDGLALNVSGDTDTIALDVGPIENPDTLTGNFTPAIPDLDFNIGWREAFARGQTQGDLLNVTAGNFPLSALNFPPDVTAEIGQLRGTLTRADGVFNLASQSLEGDIDIDQLGLGYIGAGRLTGKVRYADSLATLTNGELTLNDDLYTLNGRLALDGPAPVYSANIKTQKGNVQGLLTALSIYELDDFRRGLTPPDWIKNPLSQEDLDNLLATAATGDPDAALLDQLRRLAEIQALQTETAIAQANSPLPPLQDLSGPFAGNMELHGSGSDFELDFDLNGANWQWGQDYSAEYVIAKGSVTPNVLTLAPVRFASGIPVPNDSSAESPTPPAVEIDPVSVNLSGNVVFGQDTALTSNLQATADNLNVGTFREILQLPLDIDGRANARATFSGTIANPQLRGDAALEAATINDTPIEAADAQFIYQNARLSLASKLTAINSEQPLTLSAQIPYAFDFMESKPDSDDISVDINVQDEGLALLNIFNQQVAWESGSGQVNLTVGGTLTEPEIAGFATLKDAVLSAQILPEPLTNVTGRATFVGERIIVEALQGNFSDGQLAAAGTFPLLSPILSGAELTALTAPQPSTTVAADRVSAETTEGTGEPTPESVTPGPSENPLFPQTLAADRPLTVNFQDIDLHLDNLYSGGVNGQIIVGGSALLNGPQIGGQVVLSQGEILLPDADTGTNTPAAVPDTPIDVIDSGIVPQFRDLRLTLDDAIRIVQGNLLNFVAEGTLVLNGPPTDLEPDGTINLKSGRVSLFTTLFRLRGRDNTAEFTPEMGLQNPFLNVSLRASVPEVDTPTPITSTPFASADIADTTNTGFDDDPGSLRTIRVRATVNGPADAIFENLELSSSPPRDQTELIGLLGGGFVTALESTVGSLGGEGDGFEGLINLVGGTVLTSVQDLVGNSLSLSEFNLFPVTPANRPDGEEEENDNNTEEDDFDVGASIGFDVTDNASFSVSKVLTDSSNTEFGLNYRLTDALTVRGTTNFDDINQVLLEYELRF